MEQGPWQLEWRDGATHTRKHEPQRERRAQRTAGGDAAERLAATSCGGLVLGSGGPGGISSMVADDGDIPRRATAAGHDGVGERRGTKAPLRSIAPTHDWPRCASPYSLSASPW